MRWALIAVVLLIAQFAVRCQVAILSADPGATVKITYLPLNNLGLGG